MHLLQTNAVWQRDWPEPQEGWQCHSTSAVPEAEPVTVTALRPSLLPMAQA